MLVDNEFLHRVELDIIHKVIQYLKHQKEYVLSPSIYVNTRTGRVVMGDRPDWKCFGSELALVLSTQYEGHQVADTKYIHKWVWRDLFAHCVIWK
jgi:hypothetical protein